MINLIFLYLPKENKERQQFQGARESSQHFLGAPVDAMLCYILGNENSDAGHNVHAGRRFPSCNLFFSVIDRNDLEMAEKIKSFRSKCFSDVPANKTSCNISHSELVHQDCATYLVSLCLWSNLTPPRSYISYLNNFPQLFTKINFSEISSNVEHNTTLWSYHSLCDWQDS